jgi:uncharacterized protein (DUF58 family)
MNTLTPTQQWRMLTLKAKRQVYTLLSGQNLSKLHGEGYDFSQLREYQTGDDIRKINWLLTARLGKPYIKELHADRELSVVVAALMDGSLYFGSTNAKQKKLTEVATLLAYATQHNGNLFTGFCCTQQTCSITPPTKQIYPIEQFSKTLFDTPLLYTNLDHKCTLQELFTHIRKPSLLFVLSDFLEEVDLSLFSQKHEVIAIIIRDAEEEHPKRLLEVTLTSSKDGKQLQTHFNKKSIENYLSKLKAHDHKLQEHFTAYNIRFIKIFTHDEAVGKLLKLFA